VVVDVAEVVVAVADAVAVAVGARALEVMPARVFRATRSTIHSLGV
jgi:hypothetical protein